MFRRINMTIVTLLTDFGTADSYVAEMKGVILTRSPSTVLVDISHEVPPGDVRSAAYVLGRTWHRFPAATVHLVVVDPGVGTSRAALAFSAHDHWFVGPDNGVFTPVLHDAEVTAVMLTAPPGASNTFHGRDVFAPAAAALADGVAVPSLGEAFGELPKRFAYTELRQDGNALVGEVVYVDRFGSLITNISSDALSLSTRVEVEDLDLGGLKRTYSDVPSGSLLAYVGSGGMIEIAVRNGSAAERLGVGIGGRVRALLKG
jgi:S-adenosyl-L-methionine hydrolase (adenosine-forming)